MNEQTIVITGSTRGIGRGLAAEFLRRGHEVVVSSRSQAAVDAAVAELGPRGSVFGQACDVRSLAANQALWDAAIDRFGRVDIWICNAAVATDCRFFGEQPGEHIAATLDTNLAGTMYGTRVALAGMRQQGGGRIYTLEGFGSNDMLSPGLTTYGTTKRAIRYFTAAIARECAGSPVLVGSLSPGMVPTDLLLYSSRGEDAAAWTRARRIMNILGDPIEVVTPWLVEQALANRAQGSRITWLTRGRALRKFLVAPLRKRDLMAAVEARSELIVR